MEEAKQKVQSLLVEGKILQSLQGGIGILNMHWCGQEGDFNFLVMELMGQNLREYLELCDGKFSLKTTLMLADQILSNLEYINYKGFLHRDIRPEKFIMGLGKKSKNVYMLDFGCAKRWKDNKTNEHIPSKTKKQLISHPYFASINAMKG